MIDANYYAAAMEQTLTQRVRRERDDVRQGDGGGGTLEHGQTTPVLPCRIRRPRVQFGVEADAQTETGEWEIVLPLGADVRAQDVLVELISGKRYAVSGTDAGRTDALCLIAQAETRG